MYFGHVAKLRSKSRGGSSRSSRSTQRGKSGFGASLWRLFAILLIILVALFYIAPSVLEQLSSPALPDAVDGSDRLYLPTGPSDQIVHHQYYSIGYDDQWEQPRWVAYELTPAQLKAQRVHRTDDFRPDPQVRNGSANREDYRRSGYSRGHLVPAADMGFAVDAMSETFFYSNMSPQLTAFNGGVWRELEETSRDWVRDHGPTYIVSGPIVEARAEVIGDTRVAVPQAFYRVMLTQNGEGIGYLIPHQRATKRLEAFAVSIDDVEAATGLDFFPELAELATPSVEQTIDVSAWPSDEARYERRLKSWNNQ